MHDRIVSSFICLSLIACGHEPEPGDESPSTTSASATGGASAATSGVGGGGQGGEATTTSAGGAEVGAGGVGGGGDPCASCPDSCCDGACVDLSSSGLHCGACGHDCEGGACAAAVCQPAPLASGSTIAGLDGTDLFFADSGSLKRVPKAGGMVTTVGLIGTTASRFVLAGGYAYYTLPGNGGAVGKIALSGGDPVILASSSNPEGVATTGSDVFFSSPTAGSILRVPTGGGAVTSAVTGQTFPTDLASDASFLFFVDPIANALKRAPIPGGTAVTIQSIPQAEDIAIDANDVFVAGLQGIWKAPKTGFSGSLIVTESGVLLLALDSSSVYFIAGGDLRRASKQGGASELVIASGQVTDLEVDDDRIYFAAGGQIMKVVK